MPLCLSENKEYPVGSFFPSDENSIYGGYQYIPFCKKCIGNTAKEYYKAYDDKKLAILLTCMKYDVRFFLETYENVFKNDIAIDRLMFAYIEAQYKSPVSERGSFNDTGYSMGIFEIIKTYLESGASNPDSIKASWVSYVVTQDDLDFWGDNYSQEDYYFLTNTLNRYIESFGHATQSASTIDLVREICYTTLEIKKARTKEKTSPQDIDKLNIRLSNLLGDAHMRPNQKKDSSSVGDSFGVFIERIENEEPIPDPLPEWTANDIFKEVGQWIVGHIAKMLEKPSEDTEFYDEEMEKYTVTLEDDT